MKPEWMPPLPDKFPGEVKQWMLDYALAAVEAYKKSLKPVAWKDTMYTTGPDESRREKEPMLLGYEGWDGLPDGTDLYRIDGGNDE